MISLKDLKYRESKNLNKFAKKPTENNIVELFNATSKLSCMGLYYLFCDIGFLRKKMPQSQEELAKIPHKNIIYDNIFL